jgi:hypothetical protein
MYAANFMQGWAQLVQSLVVIALILTAFGLMLGFIQPAVALRRVAAILGLVVMLLLIPGALAGIPWWQWIGLGAIWICVWRWRLQSNSGK